LGEIDLSLALQRLVANFQEYTGLACALEVQGTPYKLSDRLELAVYRIAQEALHNVNKHAEATYACVAVEFDPVLFRMMVTDDGRGFEVAAVPSSLGECLGLVGMRERAESVGGELEIESPTLGGTQVVFEVPCGALCATGIGSADRTG
jgi:signal transduction histidine kinase